MHNIPDDFGANLLVGPWDSQDMATFIQAFAEDASWYVNTNQPARGKAAIQGLAEALMGSVNKSRHHALEEIVASVVGKDEVAEVHTVHGSVEYEREGKPNAVCRFGDVFKLNAAGKIVELYTYIDLAPLTSA